MVSGELATIPRWNPAKRIGFRFLFVYFFVSVFSPFGQLGMLLWYYLGLYNSVAAWWKNGVELVGERVFGATITATTNGSGDTTFNYVEVFCWAAIAATVAFIWSIADRKRMSYPRLFEVLRVGVRLYVAFFMMSYGACKVVPLQFGTLEPSQLVKPIGEISPMGLLWTFMAASPIYTSFGGAAEVLGGLLLVFRRTTLAGALVCAGVMSQVVMLNFCYDVPVKIFSSHLLAMSIFLIAPDAKRLWSFFVLGRPVAPAPLRPRFQRRWLNWVLASANAGLFIFLAVQMLIANYTIGEMTGEFGPKPPLHGVWDVVEFEREGRAVPPLATDNTRWKQVLVQNAWGAVMISIKPMTGADDRRILELAEDARRMTLTDSQETGKPPVTLTYEEPATGVLVLSGTVDGKPLRVKLQQAPQERFHLVNRGFHWINEKPFQK